MEFSKRFFIVQLCFLVLFGAGFFLYKNKTAHTLPILGQVEDFELTNSMGQKMSLADLKGKVWVANFMFTACSGICPMMSKNMRVLYQSFKMFDDTRFVSFSVNPENDTPQALQDYAKKYGANPQQWLFLTGSREDITKVVVDSFKLGDIKEPIFHSSYFTLVDRKGQIRGYYDGTDAKNMQIISKNLTQLLKE